MEQSNVIAMALLFAYVIFITLRGELPIYVGFLVSPVKTTDAASPSSATTKTVSSPSASLGGLAGAFGGSIFGGSYGGQLGGQLGGLIGGKL